MTNNKQQVAQIMDSEIENVKQIVSKIFDSASIRDWQIVELGSQYKIIITSDYHLPRICITELESNGYPVQTIHCEQNVMEITIGGKIQ